MTGRDLIIYILENNLEDENVVQNGVFIGFITEQEAAAKLKVGVHTVRAWHSLGLLKGIVVGDSILFLSNITDPRKEMK